MKIKSIENIISITEKINEKGIKKGLKLTKLKSLCDQYNELILYLESQEIKVIAELEKINLESNLNKEDKLMLSKIEQLFYLKNNLLYLYIKNNFNDIDYIVNSDEIDEVVEEEKKLKVKLYELIEDRKAYIYELEEVEQDLKESKNELYNSQKEINDGESNAEELYKEMEYYKKKIRNSEESIPLLKMEVLMVDIKIKIIQFKLSNITK